MTQGMLGSTKTNSHSINVTDSGTAFSKYTFYLKQVKELFMFSSGRFYVYCVILIISVGFSLHACGRSVPQVTRIAARPATPSLEIEPGEHTLGLGGWRWVNREMLWRDGLLYIPNHSNSEKLPLLIWMHGGGGKSDSFKFFFPIAEEVGIVILALDARHNTWDGIDSPFGPDVLFIDEALKYTFEHVSIDPERIALGGISDGASYALALGRSNGALFTHLVAVAPWHLSPPLPPLGRPRIFLAHGTKDNVYPVYLSRLYTVPRLKGDGYDVTYKEFDGPHWVPEPIARKMMEWLVK
jgi:phospholipase/carboxylesterase